MRSPDRTSPRAASDAAANPGAMMPFPFGNDPEAARLARRYVGERLDGYGRRDDAMLAASELVTNVLRHTPKGEGVLEVERSDASAVIRVQDKGGAGLPVVKRPTEQDTSGRGLEILEAISDRWGLRPAPGGGTEVWVAFLDLPLADAD